MTRFLSGYDPTRYSAASTEDDLLQEAKRNKAELDKVVARLRALEAAQAAEKKQQGSDSKREPEQPVDLSYKLPMQYKKIFILAIGIVLFLVAFQKLK